MGEADCFGPGGRVTLSRVQLTHFFGAQMPRRRSRSSSSHAFPRWTLPQLQAYFRSTSRLLDFCEGSVSRLCRVGIGDNFASATIETPRGEPLLDELEQRDVRNVRQSVRCWPCPRVRSRARSLQRPHSILLRPPASQLLTPGHQRLQPRA